jgi:hypothetical protein
MDVLTLPAKYFHVITILDPNLKPQEQILIY